MLDFLLLCNSYIWGIIGLIIGIGLLLPVIGSLLTLIAFIITTLFGILNGKKHY